MPEASKSHIPIITGPDKANIDSKALAPRFHTLFAGLPRAYGSYKHISQTREDGKRTGIAVTVRQPVTDELWEQHLTGENGIGIIPIRDDNTVVFGAVDIDQYDGLDHGRIAVTLARMEIPLVVCRSKSGGAHLFLFCKQPVDAGKMQDKLRDIAALLGHGTAEIFPKQKRLMPRECGAWINAPYAGGNSTDRYAVRANGDALSMEEFLVVAEAAKVDAAFFDASANSSPEPLPGGPPCLQHLVTLGFPEGSRNNGLLNAGVYFKHLNPDGFQSGVEDFNRRYMQPPLSHEEVGSILKSLAKKEYAYTCSKQPLTPHCNSIVCRTRKYGIGGGTAASLPILGAMTKYDSRPPLYWWDCDGERLELTVDEILDFRKFKRACFERLNKVLPAVKSSQWDQLVRKALETLTIETVPEDASPEGQFWEVLEQFCAGRAQAHMRDEILLGKPWTDNGRTYFRLGDLLKFLHRIKFSYLTMQRIAAVMKSRGGQPERITIQGKVVRAWSVPSFKPLSGDKWPLPAEVTQAGPF
jgi:hypothetical protein